MLCSAVLAGVAYGVVQLLSASTPFLSLFIGSAVFLVAYLVLAPVTGAVEEQDIVNLDSMLRGLWVVYPFARLFLEFEGRIIGLTFRKRTE